MNLLDYILGKRYVESQISQIKPEEKTVTPTKSQQIITPTTGKYLSKVTVNTIPDNYIIPSGTVEITDTNLTGVTRYENAQVVDSSLIPGNIKKGEIILGVTGTYEGEGGGDTLMEDGLVTGELTSYTNDRATSVKQYAFYNSNLIEANFPLVTDVGSYAFYNSPNLTNISLPQATSIGGYAFNDCKKLTGINLPNATSIGPYAFQHCFGVKSVNLPNVTSIGDYAFSQSFQGSGITSISLPKATSIGWHSFEYCTGLTSVNIPNATSINSQAFYSCTSLTSVTIPNVTEIKDHAFCDCFELTRVKTSATSIGSYAFSGCNSLKVLAITQTDSVCTLGSNAFEYCYHILGTKNKKYNPTGAKDGYIYVPDSLVSSYKTATNWSKYATQIKALSTFKVWVSTVRTFTASMTTGFNVNGQTYFGTIETYSIDLGPEAKNISLSSSTSSAFVSRLADYSYNSTTGILTVNKLYNQYPTTATIIVNYDKCEPGI